MISILPKEKMTEIEPLFESTGALVLSCLQGYMGKAYAKDVNKPECAQLVVGDFCFFGGKPDIDLLKHIPEDFASEFILMISQSAAWESMIERVWGNKAEKLERFAIKKEGDIFDRQKLQAYIDGLSAEYELRMIGKKEYEEITREEWSSDLCSVFSGYEEYEKIGIGAAILHNGQIVAGASSYAVYQDGIEIEIDTKESFRQKGLATVCAAKLILECLNKGLYPSWDAHDLRSVALAEKLGYHLDKPYVTYCIQIR